MSSLSFIPRKLAKGTNVQKSKPYSAKTNAPGESISGTSSSALAVAPDGPTPGTTPLEYDDQDYVNLISLSLSDFALWLDGEIRQKLGHGSALGPDTGYISLDYLLERSAALESLLYGSKETKAIRSQVQRALVKAVRSYASHLFDTRLLLHPDETIPRFGKQKDIGGGYEIRRKRIGLTMRSKTDWDACTLYIENIPPGYRSYAKIIRLLICLLPDAPSMPSTSTLPTDPLTRIQGISFPPHYNDKPDTRPSCKGFALVTLAHTSDCNHLKKSWPWLRETPSFDMDQSEAEDTEGIDSSARASHIARQYNFRVTSKERWLQLKAEYLAYRRKLVEEMNTCQDAQQKRPREILGPETLGIMSKGPPEPNTWTSTPPPEATIAISSLNHSSPYPPNCLVFIKNVHPETTKTTLRNLFSQGLRRSDAKTSHKNLEGLDYVDFSKGMNTCYLRLTTPSYTAAFVEYFDHRAHKIIQVSSTDETGTDVSSTSSFVSIQDQKPVVVERVIGRPEEIYWDKVPVKVKKAAVEKAIQLAKVVGQEDGTSEVRKRHLETGIAWSDETPLRKKRRKLSTF